MISTSEEWQ